MDPIYSFGQWMKRRRKVLDLTQRELAELAHCSVVTIKKIESDERRPSRELARILAGALAIPRDEVELFIDCARGNRPVDHLQWEGGPGISAAGSISSNPINPPPLPVALTPFIGREAELAMLRRLLAKAWLVTIVGIGGIGKTRLAMAAAAEQQQDGRITAFVPLAELTAEDDLSATIVETLGLQLAVDSDPLSQLLDYLQHKRLLLVLDNFEHLLEKTPLLARIHRVAPEVKLLVTSRERLRVPGEQLLPLQGLLYPHDRREYSSAVKAGAITQYTAIEFFLDHARRLLPQFEPDNEDELVLLGQITDGLPLALELAAAWVDSLTLPDLVQALQHSLDLLALEGPDRPARHHSIRAAFDTSWLRLGDAERDAFIRLSVFQGGFTRQAAESVAGVSIEALSILVGRFLVKLDHKDGRYTLHELMRQYGGEKLAALPELENEVRQGHSRFFCEFLAGKEADLKDANQIAALADIRADRANIWLAWGWAAHHLHNIPLAEAIAPLGNACRLRAWIEDGYNLFTHTTLALAENPDQPGVLPCLLHLSLWRCWFALWLGRPVDRMLANIRRMLDEIPPDQALQPVLALYHLVAEESFLDAGKREIARDHGEKALALYRDLDDEWGQANALTQLGTVCWNVGDYSKAQEYFEESLALRRQIGDSLGEAISLDRLGLLLINQGQLDLSSRYLEEAVTIFSKLGDRSGMADAMENLGSCWLEIGRWADARRQYAETAALYDDMGLRHTGYTVLMALTGYASAHMGAYERAYQEGETALALSRELDHRRSEGLALITLGLAAIGLGDATRAAAHLAAGTDHLRAISQLEELAQGIGAQALAAYQKGKLESARQLMQSALAIATRVRGLAATPDYALAVWAMLLADQGEYERAAEVYQLVLAEPFGAASRWFADQCGRFVPHSRPDAFMPHEVRWAAISRLVNTL